MNKLFGRIVIFILTVFLMTGCGGRVSAVEVGNDAPDFKLADINGKEAAFSEFKGKVIILDFFASWCPPCRQEVPDFIALQDTYSAKGFTVIGVALVSREDAKEFAARMGINYPVLVDDNKVSMAYGPVRSIPTTFVIGKDMKIKKFYVGFRSKDVFENDIKELLK